MHVSDAKMNKVVHYVLLVGSILILGLLLFGTVLLALSPQFAFWAVTFFSFAIFILIAVPLVRVVVLMIMFATSRNTNYLAISVIVLVILFISFMIGVG